MEFTNQVWAEPTINSSFLIPHSKLFSTSCMSQFVNYKRGEKVYKL